jgi:Pyruvate/2-oxoacid:ferredoxin oxidoreductase delta subunit
MAGKTRKLPVWRPSAEQMSQWPSESGNAINGVGEASPRRPSPIYWHAPDATPHGPLQKWFYGRTAALPGVVEARRQRQEALDVPLEPVAPERPDRSRVEWSAAVKQVATEAGAADAGVAAMRVEYVFDGFTASPHPWMVVLAVAQDYGAMATAPSEAALVEITRQYAHGIRVAKAVANWLRGQGCDALPYGGPMAGSFLLIPPAIEAGLGELGKHGSMIHRSLGSSFRLACVLTDAPLAADAPHPFGADDFCTRCQACSRACPPDAIAGEKQLVRGQRRWYVDFDKCLPYFNENLSCAICLAVCPFSRPGVGPSLVRKLARSRTPHDP